MHTKLTLTGGGLDGVDDAVNLLDAPQPVMVRVEHVKGGPDKLVVVMETRVPRLDELLPGDGEAEETGQT